MRASFTADLMEMKPGGPRARSAMVKGDAALKPEGNLKMLGPFLVRGRKSS